SDKHNEKFGTPKNSKIFSYIIDFQKYSSGVPKKCGKQEQFAPSSTSNERESFDNYSLIEYFQKFRNR
ncbi:MAG: hypothetical protein ACOYEG_12780, partial [Petrimonas sp.]